MTRLQRILYRLGAWRIQRFRRWVGGFWREVYIEPTPHSSECPYWKWKPCAELSSLGYTYKFEDWSTKLPIARAIAAPSLHPKPIIVQTTVRRVCLPECRCERCGYPWRGCACGATPATGPNPSCDREPLGIQYGCKAVRDRKSD